MKLFQSPSLYLLIVGVGIGWLIGLSVSPVVSIVITTVTASAAAIIAAVSGLKAAPGLAQSDSEQQVALTRWHVDPLPLMWLVIGIVVGSLLGIKARNDGWLGSPISSEVKSWTDAGILDTGLKKEDLVLRLFESHYFTGTATLGIGTGVAERNLGNAAGSASASSVSGTILFGISSSECDRLTAGTAQWYATSDPALLTNTLFTMPQLRNLPAVITDTQTLAEVVDTVICADGQSQR